MTNTATAAGTFPWSVAELEDEIAEVREEWKTLRHFGRNADQVERYGRRLAVEIAEAKRNGGWILL